MNKTLGPIILLFSLVLFSCYHENQEKVKKPDNLIPVEELTNIITDLQIAEGIYVNNQVAHIRTGEEYKDSVYSIIFKHYGITFSDFKENVNYYNTDPELMEKVYDNVLENLNKMQLKIENESKKKTEKAKADTTLNDTIQIGS